MAAVDAPTIIDKFGAINAILLSTYSNIFDLQLFNSTAISQASQIASFSSSVSSWLYTRIHLRKLEIENSMLIIENNAVKFLYSHLKLVRKFFKFDFSFFNATIMHLLFKHVCTE